MTVLIDSCAWIEYFNGTKKGESVREYIEGDEEVVISVVNVSEVYRHYLATEEERIAKVFLEFMLKRSFPITVTEKIAILAAELKHKNKWGLGDSIIYSTSELNKIKVVTCDKDFKNQNNVLFIAN